MRPRLPVTKLLLLLAALTIVSYLALSLLLPRLIDLNSYQAQLVATLQKELNRPVSLGESQFSWSFGPVFTFNDLVIREPDGKSTFVTARKISFQLSLLPLLRKKLALSEVTVLNPVIRLSRGKDGRLSIDDLLKPSADGQEGIRFEELKISSGTLIWHDAATDRRKELALTMSGIELDLDRLAPGSKSSFKLAAALSDGATGKVNAAGSIRLPKQGASLLSATVNATVKLSSLEYWRFWPYAAHLIPFPSPEQGSASLDLTLKGTWDKLAAKGDLRLHQPRVVWPSVFPYTVAPEQFQLVFDLKRTADLLDMPKIHLTADGFAFRGSLSLSEMRSADPMLRARGVTDSFDYTRVRSYIPFHLIEDDAADFIRNKIKAGIFKLNTGTLDGRISQLAKFGIGDNANTLYISGTADDAVISYGGTSPSFNRIRTALELKGRNFNLHNASAYFGNAPFTLNGSITEYATKGVPSTYPFTLDGTPGPAEVAWLASFVQLDKLTFGGNSALRLTGDGVVKAYQLSGVWQLGQAGYELSPFVKKPAGMANSLNFSSILSKNDVRITSLSYSLPPMQLSATALLRLSEPTPHLSFELQSNSFAYSTKLPILLQWQQYQPQGTAQVHLLGSGNPEDFSAMLYNGTVKLSNASLKPLENYDPVKAINGTLTFRGNSVQTSRIAVQYGNTPLTVRGRIVHLSRPEMELLISSPRLNLADFGITGPDLPPVQQFSTHLSFHDDLLDIRALTARLSRSVINASGTYKSEPAPSLILNITAPHLDIEEMLPLLAPSPDEKPGGTKKPPPLQLAGRITAENGSYRSAVFKKLAANFQNDGNALQLHSLEAGIFDGRLTANGQLVRHRERPTDWTLALKLDGAKSGDLFAALDLNREIRGRMSVSGNLKAKGGNLAEVKQSVAGDLHLEIGRGVLRRFSSLSKVFSILNLSQLLTFQMPDMANDGMPFNRITANVSLKDGILSTQDFLIDSNAMHISMVGKLNIVKEDIDMLIGVQPLQTVDKIINRIPVVGWILTGNDDNLISTYFEAKGSWADPKVTAIPVKSMAQGALGIFQRIFELPVRLFTDTGEVLLGGVGGKKDTGQPEPREGDGREDAR